MTDLSHRRIQDEELVSMRAIFGEDWTDHPPSVTAWGTKEVGGNKWSVKLWACDGRVGVTLNGKLSKHYPAQAPTLTLSSPTNLSSSHITTLQTLLNQEVRKLLNREMIFDLTAFVQEWIEVNHLPLPVSSGVPTLMEQKVRRDHEAEEIQERERKAEEEDRRRQREEEDRVLSNQIEEDNQRREEQVRATALAEEARRLAEQGSVQRKIVLPQVGVLESPIITFDRDVRVEATTTTTNGNGNGNWCAPCRDWRPYGPGKPEGLWTSYSVEGLPSSSPSSEDRRQLPLAKILIVDFPSPYYQTPPGLRKVQLFQEVVSSVVGVRHRNILTTLAVRRMDTGGRGGGGQPQGTGWPRVVILVDRLVEGGSMKGWMAACGRFSEEVAREYMLQTLEALEHLHLQDKAHLAVHLDHTLLSVSERRSVVKLAYASFGHHLTALNRSNPFGSWTQGDISDEWLSPEERELTQLDPDEQAAKDVWQAARMFTQMLWGRDVLSHHKSIKSIAEAEDEIDHGILDTLRAMMIRNIRKRLTAGDAIFKLSHRSSGQAASSNGMTIGSASRSSPGAQSFFISPITAKSFMGQHGGGLGGVPGPAPAVTLSRYRTDFEEVEWIGGGGFGQVVKARHKLEKQYYAIKKIKLNAADDLSKVYRETEALARLVHPHIVRYISSWVETVERRSASDDGTSDEEEPTTEETGEEEEDMFGPPDFDDAPYNAHEHSKSFPRIRFADSSGDDDDDEDDTGDDSSLLSPARGRIPAKPVLFQRTSSTRSIGNRPQRILYIQMEYIENQTLKEAIAQGVSVAEYWKILRQLLDALAYLAKVGIRHRDLKPANIARDANLDVKILDFGLSVTDGASTNMTRSLTSAALQDGDMTSQVGTSLYISPEVLLGRTYDSKIDIYSLAIIFFEMVTGPFSTNMERVDAIRGMRLPDVKFPSSWSKVDRANETSILQWMLKHDPADRPDAAELLQSSLLPEGREEGYYAEAIRKITQPGSVHYPKLMDRLFKPEQGPTSGLGTLEYTYDALGASLGDSQAWHRVVKERLAVLFTRHGAIELNTPLLTPITPALTALDGNRAAKATKLLDGQGHLVRLPTDGTVQFARYTNRRGIERMKRYSFGARYTETPGQPRALGEVNFDIVSFVSTEGMVGELLSIVDKIIGEFRALSTQNYEIHLSHGSLVSLLMTKVPPDQRDMIAQACSEAWLTTTSDSARLDISGANLPRAVSDALSQSMIIGDVADVKQRMVTLFPTERLTISLAFEELETTIHYARILGISTPIKIKPTLFRNNDHYRDAVFFETVRRGKRDVIAAGGRYDCLLQYFKMPKASGIAAPTLCAAGMSIAIDRLAYHIGKYESNVSAKLIARENESERSFGLWSPARCDVYVASFGTDQMPLRLEVVGELWKASISADLQYDTSPMESIMADCLQQNVLFIVIPRPSRASMKVRSVLRKTEEDVPRGELVAWLRHAIAEQRRVDLSVAGIEAGVALGDNRAVSLPSATPAAQNEFDIRLLLRSDDEKKNKRNTKVIYWDKAYDFAAAAKTHLPVFGVDISAAVAAQLCLNTEWLAADEPWKTCLSWFPGDRQYAEAIRSAVREARAMKDVPMVYLFSLREGKASILSFSGR